MKTKKNIFSPDRLSSIAFYISILLFIIAFNFAHNPPSGWYQQSLPDLNGQPLSDITFLDSLTGFAVTNNNMSNDSGYIIKTTNGGDNWNIIYKDRRDFSRVIFINSDTGFVCGGTQSGTPYLHKTINGGNNWFIVSSPFTAFWDDMSVINNDTIFLVDKNGFNGGAFKTTNGGLNWIRLTQPSGSNPNRIYMFNRDIGFLTDGTNLGKTTNSGMNWFSIPGGAFTDIYFIDSLIGWKAHGDMKKTTDGGISWIQQRITPVGGNVNLSAVNYMSFVNQDTIWGFGRSEYQFPNFQYRGMIHKTTNGGLNWGYQIPDTSIHISEYYYGDFVNWLNGWAYSVGGVHTKTGGNDTTIIVGIIKNANSLPSNFILKQNYPNPFNPNTIINYSIGAGEVKSFFPCKIEKWLSCIFLRNKVFSV